MFTKSTRLNYVLSFLFVFSFGACGGIGGGCGACSSVGPLPPGGLPADQTIEGGGQIRVTPAGFTKLTSLVPGILNSSLGQGICIGQNSIDITVASADYCYNNDPATAQIPDACGNGNGCNVGFHISTLDLSPTDNGTLDVHINLDVHSVVPLHGYVPSGGFSIGSCDMHVDATGIDIDAIVRFGIDPTTGELTIHVDSIPNFTIPPNSLSNCGIISDLGNIVVDVLDSFVGQFIVQLLQPTIDNLVQGFLPNPLGIAGTVDVSSLVGGVSPGTTGELEARMVPGGYVSLQGGGMSLGLITGLNSDVDPSTRTPDLDNEPAYCVPPIPAPDFSQPPSSLPLTSRGTFTLAPAGAFTGSPEPADDLAMGISKTTLNLAGHHLVTSGALCLGVGTRLIKQLNLGTFGLLVPSLATLGAPSNPILLVTRPQEALDFQIGDGTDTSPSITIGFHHFEVDVYVFIYERYVRAFTMKLDMNVGVNLTFDQQPGMPATVTPMLVGLDSHDVTVSVLNSEFVAETPAQLESVLPTVFDLAAGLLGNGLGSINVPSFAGFTLNDLRVQKVTTSQDDFLAIYASLGQSAQFQALAQKFPSLKPQLAQFDSQHLAGKPEPTPTARVLTVDTPAPEEIRKALDGTQGATLPTVTLDVPARDAAGQPLEYTWRFASEDTDGNAIQGLWREFKPSNGKLVISDRAFAWQGKYTIELRSRVVGDYSTTSDIQQLPVIIDSVAPDIAVDQATVDEHGLTVPASDLVTPVEALQYAWGAPTDDQPWTDYQTSATIAPDVLKDMLADGQVAVYVKDEAGNTSRQIAFAAGFHGAPSGTGCSCDSSGGNAPTTGGILLVLFTGGILFRRRLLRGLNLVKRHGKVLAIWAGMCLLSTLTPSCNCGGNPGAQACETTDDCTAACPTGQVPFCLDHTCVCTADVPYGRIGPYSDVAVDSQNNAWVSSYAESHGDLVVGEWPGDGRIDNTAWEWVDGVPDGPVAIPGSTIRGGVLDPGPNVGMYTSIEVGPGDVPEVTYFDVDNGSLKYAAKVNGAWQIHTIDKGTGKIDMELGGKIAGMYSSLSLRSDDGRPGVAYMTLASDGGNVIRAELHFAAAQTPTPTSTDDWVFWTVDSEVLPPEDPNNPDPTPLPPGLGLFANATRDANNAPVVTYYDRLNGELKMAKFNATSGTFDPPQVLDGGNGADVGLYPSVAVDATGDVHVAYENATTDNLMYLDTGSGDGPQVVDSGYRIVGTTDDGLPKPEFHFVGDDANLVLANGTQPIVVYQDSTTHELLYSGLSPTSGLWVRKTIAGDEDPFVGAFGFFAATAITNSSVVVSNWVIDQPHSDNWVQIFREVFNVQ